MTNQEWRYVKFGLIVTGYTEAQSLPLLFRSLTALGTCQFEVIRQIGQRSPISSEKRKLKMTGSGKTIPNQDEQEIGLPARVYLNQNPNHYVLLVDDLEQSRREDIQTVFDRYRLAFDTILPLSEQHRVSVHFLVNMVEAYYFAHTQVVNITLNTTLKDFDGDVEAIPHPKNQLKQICAGLGKKFDEKEDGGKILGNLDVEHVLSNPNTCASLRTLFAWCLQCLNQPRTEQYQLLSGKLSEITKVQLEKIGGGN
jgi:hypothetical protein